MGLGNPDRGEDAVGLRVVERLAGRVPPGVRLLAWPGNPIGLLELEAWRDDGMVVLVDAVVSGASFGTVHRIEATRAPLPLPSDRSSSHGLGVAATIELARALGALPRRTLLVGIEIGTWEVGRPPTPSLTGAVEEAVALIHRELAADPGPNSSEAGTKDPVDSASRRVTVELNRTEEPS